MPKFKNILVLSPHTDDGEIGCGGYINKLVLEGAKVTYVAFSTCEESIPEGLPKNILEFEVREATKVLGIDNSNLIIHKFPVRRFGEFRQDILEVMVKLNKEIRPDLVLTPMSSDIHQDHSTINNETIRAFKNISIFGYELIWNNLKLNNNMFVKLNEEHIYNKISAIDKYESQKFRNYISSDYIKSLAHVRGTQVGSKYCETFEVIRLII
jgi:LmbE family N-acetylglucosaminyl deacetylase